MSVFMCDMLDQCSIEVFTVQTYELLRTYIYIHTYMFINNFLMDGMNVVNEASPQTQRLRWMLSETIDILSKFYLTVHWRISYTQSSFSFWVHPLFCIKVRGQHLCLAVTESSSSHPKTIKHWDSLWLFFFVDHKLKLAVYLKMGTTNFDHTILIRSSGSGTTFSFWV